MIDRVCSSLNTRYGLSLYLTDEFNLQKTSTYKYSICTATYKRFSVCESWFPSPESMDTYWIFRNYWRLTRELCGLVRWATALQAGRSRVWFPIVSLSFRPHCGPEVDSDSTTNKYQVYFLGGKGGRCLRLKTFTIFMCRLSWSLGASISRNTQGLSRIV
jgi:hypothetical protein